MLIATACVCVVYLLGRDVFGSRLVGLVTAATFLTFHGFIQYASNGPREKTPMTLFIVLRAVGGQPAALVHGGALRQPRHAVPADRLLHRRSPPSWPGALLLADRGRLRALARRRPRRCGAGGGVRGVVRARGLAARVGRRLLRHQLGLHRAQPGDAGPGRTSAWTSRWRYGVTAVAARRRTGRAGAAVPCWSSGRRPGVGTRPCRCWPRSPSAPRRRAGVEPEGLRRVARPVPAAAVRGRRARRGCSPSWSPHLPASRGDRA